MQPFNLHPSSFILSPMLVSTLSNLGFLAKKNTLDPANDTRLFAGETELSLVA